MTWYTVQYKMKSGNWSENFYFRNPQEQKRTAIEYEQIHGKKNVRTDIVQDKRIDLA